MPSDLSALWSALRQPTVLIEVGVLLSCLLAAWGLSRQLGARHRHPTSILFGEHILDGALFPVLAWLFATLARLALPDDVPPALHLIVQPILLSLAVIRLTVRVLRLAFPNSALMRVVERSVSWVAWIAVVLWVTGLLPVLMDKLDEYRWTLGGSQVSLRNLLEGVLNVLVVMVLVLWLSAVIEARLLAGPRASLSTRKIAANFVRAVLLFVGVLVALSAAGINLTALGVFGGALGVGIGLGLQRLAANYVSGFVILAERSLRIGDLVRVDGFEGRITDINTRATLIRADNGRESIVPNDMLTTVRVENATRADPKVALTSLLRVEYGSDFFALRERLLEAVRAVPRVLQDPGPDVQLRAFASDGLELGIVYTIADPEKGRDNVGSAVNIAALGVLEAAGVRLAYPQRVLRMSDGSSLVPAAAPTPAEPAADDAAGVPAGDRTARGGTDGAASGRVRGG